MSVFKVKSFGATINTISTVNYLTDLFAFQGFVKPKIVKTETGREANPIQAK